MSTTARPHKNGASSSLVQRDGARTASRTDRWLALSRVLWQVRPAGDLVVMPVDECSAEEALEAVAGHPTSYSVAAGSRSSSTASHPAVHVSNRRWLAHSSRDSRDGRFELRL